MQKAVGSSEKIRWTINRQSLPLLVPEHISQAETVRLNSFLRMLYSISIYCAVVEALVFVGNNEFCLGEE